MGRKFAYDVLQAVAPLDAATCSRRWRSWWRQNRLPARPAATGDLHLQARPDPGRRLRVAAAKHPAAVPSAYCPGVGRRASPRPPRRSRKLVAQHYTAAACMGQGPGLLAAGGQRALERSAHREAVGVSSRRSASCRICQRARHARAGHRSPARPAHCAPSRSATLGVSSRVCARPKPLRRPSTTRVGWDRSRSFCPLISASGARMTRPSPPASAPLRSPQPAGMPSCTRWRTSTSAWPTMLRVTIVGRSTASGRPWRLSTGRGAASASVRSSCPP